MRSIRKAFAKLAAFFNPSLANTTGNRVGSCTPRRKTSFSNRQDLESRVMLIAYVDANNNQMFDAGTDTQLNSELLDGTFNTDVAEGNYTTVVQGAGLVIENFNIAVPFKLNLSADGQIHLLGGSNDISSVGDMTITSRNGRIVVTCNLDAGGKMTFNTPHSVTFVGPGVSNRIVIGTQDDVNINITSPSPQVSFLENVQFNTNTTDVHDLNFNLNQNQLTLINILIGGSGGAYNFKIDATQEINIENSNIVLSTFPKTSFEVSNFFDINVTSSTIITSGNLKLESESNQVYVQGILSSRNGNLDILAGAGLQVDNSTLKGFKRVRVRSVKFGNLGITMVQIGILNGSSKGKVDIKAKDAIISMNSSITAPNPNKNLKLSNPLLGSIGIFDGTVAP